MADDNQTEITALTVQLLSAYVSRNTVPSEGLAELIKTTRAALVETPTAQADLTVEPTFTPAVTIRKSLSSPDHILSLIDGRPYKTLKRHLATNGLTPEQYRERYKLPKDYPLVAASYSEARRAVAQKLGLGKKPTVSAAAPTTDAGKAAPSNVAPTADSTAPKAASTTKSAPSKKPASAAKAEPAVIAKSAPKATGAKAPKAKADKRERLSIAGPKDKAAAPAAKPVPAAGDAKSTEKTAPTKAKSATNPKSLKAALSAAGAHLGSGNKSEKLA
ncbi:MucR family transcriptional regulator [Sphingobium fuliginis]|uniref:Transcriptional regulator n=1 Tax=Sphingobium fuliginis ATCC 27551 TaxID=1208342 RepID=A0A5B8CG05_SPHSA|nr:MucR family transcriptional regulator [Sphingobium fuliginis]QDC36877.1 transcriptional regulator [Sphingobium fuliginis ATCC 27551]